MDLLTDSREHSEAIEALRANVDTLIVIPNDRLLDVVEEGTPLQARGGAWNGIKKILKNNVSRFAPDTPRPCPASPPAGGVPAGG